jgi:hypothetical protein
VAADEMAYRFTRSRSIKEGIHTMSLGNIARSLAGALLVSSSALAQSTTTQTPSSGSGGSAPVTVINTTANPVPTVAQGTTRVSGAVDILSQPPITGSVAVTNTPTVNVSSMPAVQLSGTPTVQVAGAQFDSGGNLKVTGSTSAASGRVLVVYDGAIITLAPGNGVNVGFTNPNGEDISDCRSLTAFYAVFGPGSQPKLQLQVGASAAVSTGVRTIAINAPGTAIDYGAAAFLVPGTSTPVTAQRAFSVTLVNTSTTDTANLLSILLYCSR